MITCSGWLTQPEIFSFTRRKVFAFPGSTAYVWSILGVGHREPELIKSAESGDPTARTILTYSKSSSSTSFMTPRKVRASARNGV